MPFTSETAIYGGKKPGAGRKKGDPVQKAAAEIAREYIEKNVKPIMETYVGLAAGQIVKRITEAGEESFELKVDPATTRHALDKLLPEIKSDANQRPIAIQVVIEQGTNGNGTHPNPQSAWNSGSILIGGE